MAKPESKVKYTDRSLAPPCSASISTGGLGADDPFVWLWWDLQPLRVSDGVVLVFLVSAVTARTERWREATAIASGVYA